MITLYKGFADHQTSPLPHDLAQIGQPLHFSKYLSVAEFYGQNGFIAVYTLDTPVNSEQHQESQGPPFDFHVPDYQSILSPQEIETLTIHYIVQGQLLPGGFIVGPDGSITTKSPLPPKIFTQIPKYNESHFS